MPKKYKIKRYNSSNIYRAKPHPVTVVLSILLIGGLIYLGTVLYGPVYRFIMGEVSSPPQQNDIVSVPESQKPSETEPEPEPIEQPAKENKALKALYLPADMLLSEKNMEAAVASVKDSEINAFMLDIKDSTGTVLFASKNPKAVQWGAVAENALDLQAIATHLRDHNIDMIVRMSAFRDPLAARSDRETAIRYRDTEWLWLDNAEDAGGKPWLNPYAPDARQYITDLAMEAVQLGAKMVVLDDLHYPAGSEANANFGPLFADTPRADVLKSYVSELDAKLLANGARLAVYISAASLLQPYENETRYGGTPLYLAGESVVINALPYQYDAEGFTEGQITLEKPIENPVAAVNASLSLFLDAYPPAGKAPAYIPLIQGGNEKGVNDSTPYTREVVQAQIEAVKSRGLEEYILYVTDGNYLLQSH